jgi:GNAT superfamily N-acetyltransferase
MTGVTLRAAGGPDAPAITEVLVAARWEMTYLPHLHTNDHAARFIFDLVAMSQVEVAVAAETIIGFAAVRGTWLEHLYVHPRAQNAGVGSLLIDWAKQISPTGLDLWVFQRNTGARALYAAHGWRDVLFTEGDNEEKQPDAHMRWEPGRDG